MRWPFSKKPKANPFAIPIPEGIDPSAFERVPTKLWQSDPDAAARSMREKNAQLFDLGKRQAGSVGATHYIWRSANDTDVCGVCAARNGKRFAYGDEPLQGHASICTACPAGYCRCYAEPIIPDL